MSDQRSAAHDPQGLPTAGDGRDVMAGAATPEPLIVIALAGKARSGKDTIAAQLIAEHGFVRTAFADGIRASLSAAAGPSWDILKEIEAGGKSLRWAMQTLGTECRKDAGSPNHWVDQAAMMIRFLSHYHPEPRRRFVITDMRYPLEKDILEARLWDWNAYIEVWKVERPGGPEIALSGHSSETSVDRIEAHRFIRNAGTKAELAAQVRDCMEMILP